MVVGVLLGRSDTPAGPSLQPPPVGVVSNVWNLVRDPSNANTTLPALIRRLRDELKCVHRSDTHAARCHQSRTHAARTHPTHPTHTSTCDLRSFSYVELRQTTLGPPYESDGPIYLPSPVEIAKLVQQFPTLTFNYAFQYPLMTVRAAVSASVLLDETGFIQLVCRCNSRYRSDESGTRRGTSVA